MSVIRTLAWGLAGLFVAATVVHLADQLNLFVQPPNLPESTNLVDRVLASINYRHDVWPSYFGANLLLALAFVALTGLGFALAARIPASDERRAVLAAALVVGGILGAVGQLILIGSVKASIDIPYCDCGFKQQEIVSQVWALMVTQGAQEWLVNGALLLGAIGIAVAGNVFGSGLMPERWTWLSWGISALVILSLVLGFADLFGDVQTVLTGLLTGILIPIWAIWLGLRFEGQREATSPA
jgi:hypothetical protein